MPTDAQPEPVALKPKRRWLQVSVRMMLVLAALVCIGLGLAVWRAERQRRAVAAIESVGGFAQLDRRSEDSSWFSKLLLRQWWNRFDEVVAVSLWNSSAEDVDLKHLRSFSGLKSLRLAGANVTDTGLVPIQALVALESLDLCDTQISDNGLARIQGLTALKRLELDGTKVTGVGLGHLSGLTSLDLLSLSGTQVTDAGQAHLKGLTGLHNSICGTLSSATRDWFTSKN